MGTALGYGMPGDEVFGRRIIDYGMPATHDRLRIAGYGMGGDGHASYGVLRRMACYSMRATEHWLRNAGWCGRITGCS